MAVYKDASSPTARHLVSGGEAEHVHGCSLRRPILAVTVRALQTLTRKFVYNI